MRVEEDSHIRTVTVTQSDLNAIERDVAITEHALAILMGRPPGAIERGWALDEQPVPPELPAGLTGDMLGAASGSPCRRGKMAACPLFRAKG